MNTAMYAYALAPTRNEFARRIEDERARLKRARTVVSVAGVQLTIGDICSRASKPQRDCRMIYRLIREVRPRLCLELGTCLGVTAAYQAAALESIGGGRLYTIDVEPELVSRARDLLTRVGLDHRVESLCGRFEAVLPDLLAEHTFNFVFIDGHHEEEATVGYFDAIKPALSPGATVLFDDIAWSDGMKRAWKRVQADPSITRKRSVLGMGLVTLS